MYLYVSKSFTATVNGSVVKEVDCEKCHGRFYFQLARAASDSASAPYYIGQEWAKLRAQRGAARKLAKLLSTDSELVPCPHCAHMQEFMLRNHRRRMYRGLWLLGCLIPAAGLPLIGFIAFLEWSSHKTRVEEENHDTYFISPAICVAAAILLLLLRRFLAMRLGQKGNEQLLKGAMLGAPPPLLPEQHAAADGQIPLRPAPRFQPAQSADDHFVVFPLLRVAFPAMCCECLSPSDTHYRSLMNSGENKGIQVPLCKACARRVRRRGWGGFAIAALMCFSAAGLLVLLPMKMDMAGRVVLAVLIGVIAILLAVSLVPSVLSPPFTYKVLDRHRAIVRLSFRNPQYTQLLQKLIENLEGEPQVQDVTAQMKV
jgi:hypothetical protein